MTEPDRPSFRVELGGRRPLTLNAERSLHWSASAQLVADWKEAAGWSATRAGVHRLRLDRAVFEFRPVYLKGPWPDTGSVFPTEKAVIDALIDLDVLPDDNRWHNAGQLSLPPVSGPFTGLVVRVRARPPLELHPAPLCSCRAGRLKSQMANQLRSRKSNK